MLCVLIYLGLFSLPYLLSKQMTAAYINGCKVTANNDSGFFYGEEDADSHGSKESLFG